MAMYNLSEYGTNHSMTSESLWNYCRDETNDDENENDDNHNTINNNKTTTSKSFEYKTKVLRRTLNNNNTLDTEAIVPLKDLSNFWGSLHFPLINCEIELDSKWEKIV